MKKLFLILVSITIGLNVSLQAQNLEGTCWGASTCNPSIPLVACFENDTLNMEIEPNFTFLSHYGSEGDSIIWFLDITLNCPDTGWYNYEIVDDMLLFTLIEDECDPRVDNFINCWELVLIDGGVGISENEAFLGLLLYPNPAKSTITIQRQSNIEIDIQMLDIYGRVVMDTYSYLDQTIIPLVHLSNGMYTLILKNGDHFTSEKVMVLN